MMVTPLDNLGTVCEDRGLASIKAYIPHREVELQNGRP
jgi:hypothetical protein